MVGPTRLRQRTVNGLEDRVRIIEELVKGDMLDTYRGPKLRALAGQIVRSCPARGNSSEETAGACELYSVFSFVESNVRYNGDATLLGGKGIDLFQSPIKTLEMAIGDCDDMCGVVLALLRFQGYHAWLRVCSYPPHPDEWAHIYAVTLFPKVGPRREVVMDVTLGKDKIGIERPYAKKVDFGR
jgi:hypothetical protein